MPSSALLMSVLALFLVLPIAASQTYVLNGPDVSLSVVVNDGDRGNRTYISEFYLKRAGALATGNSVFNFTHAPTGEWSDIRLSSTAIAWEGGAAGSTGGVATLQSATSLTLANIVLGTSTESWALDVSAGFSWSVNRTYTTALNITCERGPALVFDTEYSTGALPTASQIPSVLDAGMTFNPSSGCGFACSMDSGPDAAWSLAVTARPTQSLFFAPSLLAFESTLACDGVTGGCGMLLAWPDIWKGSVIAWGVVPISPAGAPGLRAVAAGSGANFTWAWSPAAANGAPLVDQACPQGVVPFNFTHPDAHLQAITCQVAAAFGMWAGNVVGNSPGTTVCLHEMSVFPLGQGIFSGMTGHTALQQQLDMFANHGVREDGFVFPRWQFNAFSDMLIHDQIGHFLTAFYWHAVNTGNVSAITAVWPVLMRVVSYVNSTMLFGENGIATTPAPATGLPGSVAGNWFDIVNFGGDDAITNAYICQGLNATALLAAWIGEEGNATTLAAMHARCAATYNARFWNASLQLYGDWVDVAGNPRFYGYIWQQALATDPLAGIANATRAAAMAGAVQARLDAIRTEYNKTAAELWCAPTNLWPVLPGDTYGNGTVQDQAEYGNYENGACFVLLHGMYEALLHHAGLPEAVFDALNATLSSAASTLLWGQHFDWRWSGSFEGFDVLSDTLYVLRAGLHGAFGLRQSLGLLEAVPGAAASGMEGASWSFTHMGQPVRATVVGGTSVIEYL